jgi:uncharacterized protein YjbI with pentapeptide repeats
MGSNVTFRSPAVLMATGALVLAIAVFLTTGALVLAIAIVLTPFVAIGGSILAGLLYYKLRRLSLRTPAVLMALGVVATLVLALGVVIALLRTGDAEAVTNNAALIGALVALGGVFTAQMVSIALEAQRAHETALQNYFEQVGTLLIEQPLRRASPGDNLSTLVRAQTLTTLDGLDSNRKRNLLQFLNESGLIHKDKPVVSLQLANLSGANLSEASLGAANLWGANLKGANLKGAFLSDANLSRANLEWAKLQGANLEGANLERADLTYARLEGANLSDADLSRANLEGANLRRAKGTTNNQLEQARSLKDATMPDGSKHP